MQPTRYSFCTLFDRNYLSRGVALYRSLEALGIDFTLHVLCLDDETVDILSRLSLPHVRLIRLSEFEDQDLLRAKANRSLVEYYWTCTAALLLYVLARDTVADVVTYLDADLFFFSEPSPLFAEMGDASVMIQPHRFPPRLAHLTENGIYNVGWVTFRRDAVGLACAKRWRDQCIEWCYYRVEDGKLGDQKYLDTWPQDFRGVHVMGHKGGGLAPWNIEQYRIHAGGPSSSRTMVDDEAVVFFHFHGMRLFDDGRVQRAPDTYPLRTQDIEHIYEPYEAALRAARAEINRVSPGYTYGGGRTGSLSAMHILTGASGPGGRSVATRIRSRLRAYLTRLSSALGKRAS